MDIVDVIVENPRYDKGNKLIKLFAVIMLSYRQELKDKTWDAITDLFGDKSLTSSFSFLMGFSAGQGSNFETQKYEKFIQSDLQELKRING